MRKILPLLALAVLLLCAMQAQAQTVVFSDGFESYNANAQLDYQGPWQPDLVNGNSPTDLVVYNSAFSIPQLPGSTKYAAGNVPSDWDGNLVSLKYHAGGGNNLAGDFYTTWWFYDPTGAGSGAKNYTDCFCLDNVGGLPANAEPTATSGYSWIQRFEVGASGSQGAGFDATKYQVRCFGITNGYNGTTWANTAIARTVGWHQGEIAVSPTLENGQNTMSVFIDNNLAWTGDSGTTGGYNMIELISAYTSQVGAFDNISVTVPEPSAFFALGTGLLGLLGLIKRRK